MLPRETGANVRCQECRQRTPDLPSPDWYRQSAYGSACRSHAPDRSSGRCLWRANMQITVRFRREARTNFGRIRHPIGGLFGIRRRMPAPEPGLIHAGSKIFFNNVADEVGCAPSLSFRDFTHRRIPRGKNEVSPLGEPLILNCVEFLILPPSDPSFGDHGTFQSNFPCSLIPCEIPLHSLLQSDKERHCWLPPQISFQFLRIDGISEIMSWPIVNKGDELSVLMTAPRVHLIEQSADSFSNIEITSLTMPSPRCNERPVPLDEKSNQALDSDHLPIANHAR